MKAYKIIEVLGSLLNQKDLVVSSNGNISREAYHLLPRPQVYLRGSMGLPVSVGLGLALAKTDRRVLVIAGDGNFLMGLGSAITAAHYRPANLKLLVLDNASYFTTGGQDTVSSTIDYQAFFSSVGLEFGRSLRAREDTIKDALKSLLSTDTMAALHLEISPGRKALSNIPWHPEQITKRFRSRLGVG